MSDLLQEYSSRLCLTINEAVSRLDEVLHDALEGIERIDRISVRAKSAARFVEKARKKNDDGSERYPNPFHDIQDIIGARVIVFFLGDVDLVSNRLDQEFQKIEIQKKEPESWKSFGYFGKHFIFHVPPDCYRSQHQERAPRFFEMQVKTLFQHAWSEASHDIEYKEIERPLKETEKRLVAFTAAQAWGADKAFQDIVDGKID